MNLKQSVHLTSISNARELGGYRTADGREVKRSLLLRTGNLSRLSAEDMRALVEVYRLQHIVDLRMDMELKEARDPAVSGAEHHHLSVIDSASYAVDGQPAVDMSAMDPFETVQFTLQCGMLNDQMYIGFLDTEMGRRAFEGFFRVLLAADPDRAVLWHCTSGKDRTGLAAMLLLTALGADESLIMQDFLLTNEYNAPRIAATRDYLTARGCDDAFIEQGVLIFDAVDGSYLRNAIEYLKQTYGSVLGYITDGLHISQDEIHSLKEKYLY